MTTLDLSLTVEVIEWDALDLWYLERSLTNPADRLLYVLDRSMVTSFEFAPVTDPVTSPVGRMEPGRDRPGDGVPIRRHPAIRRFS